MAERESSGGGWLGFIAAIALVAVIGAGIYAFTGMGQNRDVAELEINVPDVDLPEPPTVVPPSAEDAAPAPAAP